VKDLVERRRPDPRRQFQGRWWTRRRRFRIGARPDPLARKPFNQVGCFDLFLSANSGTPEDLVVGKVAPRSGEGWGAAGSLGLCSACTWVGARSKGAPCGARTHSDCFAGHLPACAEKAFAPFTAPIRPSPCPARLIPLPPLEMRGISKSFGGVRANADIDLTLARGDSRLLRRDGAGKHADEHPVRRHRAMPAHPGRGTSACHARRRTALRRAIGMVHQHFHLAPRLTCSTTSWRPAGSGGRLDRPGGLAGLGEIERIRPGARCDRPVASLSVGEQQRLEIIRRCFRGPDPDPRRPTAVLRPPRSRACSRRCGRWRRRGRHHLHLAQAQQVRAHHRCLVLRHGGRGEVAIPGTPAPPRWRG